LREQPQPERPQHEERQQPAADHGEDHMTESMGVRSDRCAGVLPAFVTRVVAVTVLVLAWFAPCARADDGFPMQLPGDAMASSVRSVPDSWLIGARPGAPSD